MATISQYLSQIKSAIYGSEVRDSIHDALSAINQQAELAQNVAVESQNSAAQMAINAENSATAAAQSATDAAGTYDTVNQAATAAANSAAEASQYVTTAETIARNTAAEEVAKIVANADSSYDTLKEIADWIQTHSSSASAMNSAIVALTAKLVLGTYIPDGETDPVEYATVKAYVEEYVRTEINSYNSTVMSFINAQMENLDKTPVLPINPSSSTINSYSNGTMWIVTE